MSILRSLLARVVFLSANFVVAGCSESANGPTAVGDPVPSAQVGGNTNGALGSAGGGVRPDGSINPAGDSGKGGTSLGNSDSSGTRSSGGASSSNKVTDTGGATPGGSSASAATTTKSASTGGQSQSPATTATGGNSASNSATGGTSSGKGLTLYYIRHGEVVANTLEPDQVTYENSEILTDLGLRQIDALTKYLQELGVAPDAVLVSPTKRAQKTIEPYLVAQGIQGEIWMELTECCTETPTGAALPTEPKYAPFKATIEGQNLAFRDADSNKYWQNDSYEAGLFMVMTAKNEILSRYDQSGKTIFVVGHASAGQIMIGLLRGEDLTQGATKTGSSAVYLLNTGIMHLTQDPATGAFKLEGRNINNPQRQ